MAVVEKSLHESSKSKIVLEIDAFPFRGLKISEDWKLLETVQGRTLCVLCKKSRKYFCYTCHVPVAEIQHIVPKVKLPIKIDIIKHAREMDGKSTATHAAVLAPEDVRIFTYPCIPDYPADENVVLIFPNQDAVSVENICEQFLRRSCEPESKRLCTVQSRKSTEHYGVHRAVFIDSTWPQSRGIFKDPRIKALPSVVLRSRLSQFWRHQTDSPRWYLATIEAIHQFLLELDSAQWRLNHPSTYKDTILSSPGDIETTDAEKCRDQCVTLSNVISETKNNSGQCASTVQDSISNEVIEPSTKSSETNEVANYCYNGQYDNLLFFFRFMYSQIHTWYDHEQLKSYKRRIE